MNLPRTTQNEHKFHKMSKKIVKNEQKHKISRKHK